ncbi:LigA [Burkholderia ambifaria]
MGAHERLQPGGQGLVQQALLCPERVLPRGVAGDLPGRLGRDRRGGVEPGQIGAPPGFVGRTRMTREPVDVPAVSRRRRRDRGRAGAGERQVIVEHFLHQRGGAPAVENDVVRAPAEPITCVRFLNQRAAEQRRPMQIEAAPPVVGEERIEVLRAAGRVAVSPVEERPRQVERMQDGLDGMVAIGPRERGAQYGMARERVGPGLPERGHLERAADDEAELLEVGGRVQFVQRMEQNALLQGRQRVAVFDVVPRGVGHRRHELEQAVLEMRGQVFDRLPLVETLAVAPVHLKLAVRNGGDDLERVRAPGPLGAQRTEVFGRRAPAIGLLQHGIELPVIVEQDIGIRQRGEAVTHGIVGAQVAEQRITEAVGRNPAQLLLPGTQRFLRRVHRVGLEHDRVDGGEPAHRSGDVERRIRHVAAVTFEIDPGAGVAGGHAAGLRERDEQDVVDAGVVGPRQPAQQRRGVGFVQLE